MGFELSGLTDYGPWDHHTLWGIFSLQGMFGYPYVALRPQCIRQLRFNKLVTIDKYHAKLTWQLQAHNLFNQMMKINFDIPYDEATRELNRLDKIRCQIMLLAEKKCRHIS